MAKRCSGIITEGDIEREMMERRFWRLSPFAPSQFADWRSAWGVFDMIRLGKS